MREVANSCASTLRYFEARDDFNFLKSSRIRLGYFDGDVTLEVCACACRVRVCVCACGPSKWYQVRFKVTVPDSLIRVLSEIQIMHPLPNPSSWRETRTSVATHTPIFSGASLLLFRLNRLPASQTTFFSLFFVEIGFVCAAVLYNNTRWTREMWACGENASRPRCPTCRRAG